MPNADRILRILLKLESDVEGLRRLNSALGETKRQLDGFVKGIAIGAGFEMTQQLGRIPAAFKESISDGIRFNATLESARLGVAAIIKQFDESGRIRNFDDALAASQRTLDLLKDKAKETAATFSELVEGYQANAGPLFQSGINNAKQQVEIVVAASQAMAALSIPTFQLNQELRAIFQGEVSKDARLNQVLQITKTQIDKAVASGTAYELVMNRMGSFAEAGARAQETLNTRFSNFSDIATELKAIGTVELFEQMRAKIGELNDYLSQPQTAESIRGWGAALAEGVGRVGKMFEQDLRDLQKLSSFIGSGDLFAEGQLRQFTETQAKALENLREQIAGAVTLEQQDRARTAVTQQILGLIERGKTATGEMKASIADAIQSSFKLAADFNSIVGTSKQAGRNIRDIVTALDEAAASSLQNRIGLLKSWADEAKAKTAVDNQLGVARARAGGDDALNAEQRRQSVEAFRLQAVIAYGEAEGKVLADEYAGWLKATAAADAHKNSLKGNQEVLKRLQDARQTIESDPFSLTASKRAELIPILQKEAAQLRATGDAWGALRVEQELATLNFTGEFQASMVSWVNGMGTAAQQSANLISGTLNSAIQQTSQLLTDAIFRTGDWRTAILQVGETFVQQLIAMGIQLVIQKALGETLAEGSHQRQQSRNIQTLATAAPAAAAQSGASSGFNWVLAGVAAVAAIALILGLLAAGGAFHEGGVVGQGRGSRRGRRGPLGSDERLSLTMLDEVILTREQAENVAIVGNSHLFTASQRNALPRFAVGGRVKPEQIGGIDLPASGYREDGGITIGAGNYGGVEDLGGHPHRTAGGGNVGVLIPRSTPPSITIAAGSPTVEFPQNLGPLLLPLPPVTGGAGANINRGRASGDMAAIWNSNRNRGVVVESPYFAPTDFYDYGRNPVLGGVTGAASMESIPSVGAWSYAGTDAPVGSIVGRTNDGHTVYQGPRGERRVGSVGQGAVNAPPTYAHDINSERGFEQTYATALNLINAPGAPNKFWTPDERGATLEPSVGGSAYNRALAARLANLTPAQRDAILRSSSLHAADGMRIPGPPSDTDSVFAMLATGEHVINARAVKWAEKEFGYDMFDQVNNMTFAMPAMRFADGGRVRPSAGTSGAAGRAARGKSNQPIHVYNYIDRDRMHHDFMSDPALEKHIVGLQKKWGR